MHYSTITWNYDESVPFNFAPEQESEHEIGQEQALEQAQAQANEQKGKAQVAVIIDKLSELKAHHEKMQHELMRNINSEQQNYQHNTQLLAELDNKIAQQSQFSNNHMLARDFGEENHPLREEADIYIFPDQSFAYINNLLKYLQSKKVRVLYFTPGYTYKMEDIILLPYKPSIPPSNFTFTLTNNKREVWNFLKATLGQRGFEIK